MYHFILAKAFEDPQETFPEKFLVSGFGADAHTFLSEKGVPKNFAPNTPLYFGENF